MKKTLIILSCVTLFACSKNGKDQQNQPNSNSIVWAETSQSTLPMVQDTNWTKEEWDKAYKVNKELIFNSVKDAVLKGKLKAYLFLQDKELTIDEFNHILVKWDSTNTIEDVNHPGTRILAPIKFELKPEYIVQLRCDEKIVYDTVSNTLTKKVSVVHFIKEKLNEKGEAIGLTPAFDVKFPDGSAPEAKK